MLIIIFDTRTGEVNSEEYWHACIFIPLQMRYFARATQNHALHAGMDTRRRYIFADCANILVEAGSETFVRKRDRRWLLLCGELSSILLRWEDGEWLLGFHLAGKYRALLCCSRWKVKLLSARIALNLIKLMVIFELEVMRYRAFQAKCVVCEI